jgi:uroporphyrin-III C-methyltransferase
MRQSPGKVWLVGAGPGAPDLITVRGASVLAQADIVFYDALVHPGTLAYAARAEQLLVGKRCGGLATAQRFINKRLIDAAQRHRVVVRLKGGDPMLFGRAQEEIAALESAGIDYEIVPGVTSALSAAAEAGISLTQRGVARSVAFVTPRVASGEAPSEWAKTAVSADTAVIYMGAGQAAGIAATLLAQGVAPQTPVLIVENASLPNTRRYFMPLSELPHVAQLGLSGPALIMLGPVFAQRAARATEEIPLPLQAGLSG